MSDPVLTIGMAAFNDDQGVWWTLSAIRAYHVELSRDDVELLVIDDAPVSSKELVAVCGHTKTRYVHKPKGKGPAHAKNSIWEEARGSHVLMIDCHVLLGPGSVDYLVSAAEAKASRRDMWVGPLRSEGGHLVATELLPELRGDFFGVWHVGPHEPHEVHAHGSAYAFMARAEWPGFSNDFRGFAGEEIYIHDRVRRNGGKVMYHPRLEWVHRFPRFGPVTYPLTLNDKLRNYCIAAYEMGWNVGQMREYFGRKLPTDQSSAVEAELLALHPDIWAPERSTAGLVRAHD
jgi:glycosyltransferase involved in cell wall biosynthesis